MSNTGNWNRYIFKPLISSSIALHHALLSLADIVKIRQLDILFVAMINQRLYHYIKWPSRPVTICYTFDAIKKSIIAKQKKIFFVTSGQTFFANKHPVGLNFNNRIYGVHLPHEHLQITLHHVTVVKKSPSCRILKGKKKLYLDGKMAQ
jgi:hypothetical protein